MAGQRHDLRRRKWEASEPARREAAKRRAHRKKLMRRKKLRAMRASAQNPGAIAEWREAKRKSGS